MSRRQDADGSRLSVVDRQAITYIPMRRGFMYLFAVLDGQVAGCWPGGSPTRSQPISLSMRCRRRLLGMASRPSSIPTKCQFSSLVFTWLLTHHGIQISGRVLAKRHVRRTTVESIKYKEVSLHAYETVRAVSVRGTLSDLQPDQAASGA